MTTYVAGLFFCALVVGIIVIVLIVYIMFFKERPKEKIQYDITDLRVKNYELAQTLEKDKEHAVKKNIVAGVFILPRRHKQKDEKDGYEKRPDYPESPVPLHAGTDNLVEIFNENVVDADVHDKDFAIESSAYHSEV